jgi:hypothetical protein
VVFLRFYTQSAETPARSISDHHDTMALKAKSCVFADQGATALLTCPAVSETYSICAYLQMEKNRRNLPCHSPWPFILI